MRYLHFIFLFLFALLIGASCANRVTCPAYQSSYLLDTAYFKKTFSLFVADSVPNEQIGIVKKNKYGIIEEKPYKQKIKEMNSIEMVTIYPGYEDSIALVREFTDSLAVDSAQLSTASARIHLNYDQLLYNSMYGELLYPPRKPVNEVQEDLRVEENPQEADTTVRKRGRFKLFKKKPKAEEDPAEEEADELPAEQAAPVVPVEEEEDDGF